MSARKSLNSQRNRQVFSRQIIARSPNARRRTTSGGKTKKQGLVMSNLCVLNIIVLVGYLLSGWSWGWAEWTYPMTGILQSLSFWMWTVSIERHPERRCVLRETVHNREASCESRLVQAAGRREGALDGGECFQNTWCTRKVERVRESRFKETDTTIDQPANTANVCATAVSHSSGAQLCEDRAAHSHCWRHLAFAFTISFRGCKKWQLSTLIKLLW